MQSQKGFEPHCSDRRRIFNVTFINHWKSEGARGRAGWLFQKTIHHIFFISLCQDYCILQTMQFWDHKKKFNLQNMVTYVIFLHSALCEVLISKDTSSHKTLVWSMELDLFNLLVNCLSYQKVQTYSKKDR